MDAVRAVHRAFIELGDAALHVATCGDGLPVILLHQTPRSWDEYRDVAPLLAARDLRAIAPDTPGFGDSKPIAGPASIESWARSMIGLVDALGLARFALVGHHTGAAIAVEIAATLPGRVCATVLSAPPLLDEAARARRASAPRIDHARRRPDGSHLVDLWRQRQPWYPPGDVDLLERCLIDTLKAGARAAEGHAAVAAYAMAERLPCVRCPTLVLDPAADPHAHPHSRRVAQAIAGARCIEVEGAMVPFPDQMPERFAALVADFVLEVAGRP